MTQEEIEFTEFVKREAPLMMEHAFSQLPQLPMFSVRPFLDSGDIGWDGIAAWAVEIRDGNFFGHAIVAAQVGTRRIIIKDIFSIEWHVHPVELDGDESVGQPYAAVCGDAVLKSLWPKDAIAHAAGIAFESALMQAWSVLPVEE
jgi:hypothetical protein